MGQTLQYSLLQWRGSTCLDLEGSLEITYSTKIKEFGSWQEPLNRVHMSPTLSFIRDRLTYLNDKNMLCLEAVGSYLSTIKNFPVWI